MKIGFLNDDFSQGLISYVFNYDGGRAVYTAECKNATPDKSGYTSCIIFRLQMLKAVKFFKSIS